MRITYLIIDDFYDDPHAVRNTALHTDYARMANGANYSGDNSAEAFELEGLNEFVSDLVHEPVKGTPNTGHCRFRIATAGAEAGPNSTVTRSSVPTVRPFTIAKLLPLAVNPASASPRRSSNGTATTNRNGSM